MDLNNLSLALRVADLGSFSGVAREAGLAPSSVSRAVATVEDRVGLRLFQRSSRALSLTAEGEAYLRRVAPLVEEMEEARQSARAGRVRPRGRLRLTASLAYGTRRLVPLLAEFRRVAPDLEVDLALSDATLDLVAERIDLAVRLAPAPAGDLISARLHDTAYRVVAAPAWCAENPVPTVPGDLSHTACLRTGVSGHSDAWRFRAAPGAQVQEVPVRGPFVISSPLALRDAALAGLGPALLADWLVDGDIAAGRLRRLLPDVAATASDFDTAAWILYPSRAYLPAKVRTAIDLLRRTLG